MKALLVLECEGYQLDGFYFCDIVKNTILDLEETINTENYLKLIQYLDGVVEIFEKPCNKAHLISNAMYKCYEMGYINDKLYENISNFYRLHQRCSLILKCLPKEGV